MLLINDERVTEISEKLRRRDPLMISGNYPGQDLYYVLDPETRESRIILGRHKRLVDGKTHTPEQVWEAYRSSPEIAATNDPGLFGELRPWGEPRHG